MSDKALWAFLLPPLFHCLLHVPSWIPIFFSLSFWVIMILGYNVHIVLIVIVLYLFQVLQDLFLESQEDEPSRGAKINGVQWSGCESTSISIILIVYIEHYQ